MCTDHLHLKTAYSESDLYEDYIFTAIEYWDKLRAYYIENGRPPYMEAFLIHRLQNESRDLAFITCWPMVLLSELLVLEAELFTRGSAVLNGNAFLTYILDLYGNIPPTQRSTTNAIWPIDIAIKKVTTYMHTLIAAPLMETSVSFVICHCHEPLDWLKTSIRNIPRNSKLYIYEKCRENNGPWLAERRIPDQFSGGVFVIQQPDGPSRGDECTAYLDYIVQGYDSPGMSDYTVFLQADPDRHMFISYLNTILSGINAGTYREGFLHLNFHRHYQTTTPCMRDVERYLFNHSELVSKTDIIGTYCCAQFVVHKSRIYMRQKRFYQHALSMVDGSGIADICSPTPPRRSSHCYVLEYLWHVILGEERFLPFKADDPRLPSVLRMKFGNENHKLRWDDVELVRASGRPVNRIVDIGAGDF
jgi:hypothetical protein